MSLKTKIKAFNFRRIGLLPRILVAIVSGVLLGGIMPEWLTRIFITFNDLFGEFLTFLIPLIILGLVTVAIADIGNRAGKILGVTVLISYSLTVVAGLFSYVCVINIFPHVLGDELSLTAAEIGGLPPYFSVEIPPLMGVVTALVLAFVLGIGLANQQSKTLLNVAKDFRAIVEQAITKVIIPMLPIYIFGIFANMTTTGSARNVLSMFLVVIGVVVVLLLVWILIKFCVAAAIVKRNPFKLLVEMLPAFFTALGTSSSAATIPVTLEQVKKMGVSTDVTDFVVPLCATIHLSGSELKIVACSVAIFMMQGLPISFELFLPFIAMIAIMTVAAPGIPGGVVMAVLPLLQSMLGFGETEQALMISLYLIIDSFGTATNVTGDGAVALVVDKWFGIKSKTTAK